MGYPRNDRDFDVKDRESNLVSFLRLTTTSCALYMDAQMKVSRVLQYLRVLHEGTPY